MAAMTAAFALGQIAGPDQREPRCRRRAAFSAALMIASVFLVGQRLRAELRSTPSA